MAQLQTFIILHWPLCVSFIIVLTLIILNELKDSKHKAKTLTPAQVVERINHNQAIVIDIRDAEQFKAGHIIDAKRIKPNELTDAKIATYKEKPIILVCVRGITAMNLATQLKSKGHQNVLVLEGGMNNWVSHGLPIVKGK